MKLIPALVLSLLLASFLSARDSVPVIEIDPPDSVAWETALGEVVFPHAFHVDDLGVDCDSCHHETTATRLAMPHPGYFDDFWIDCAACHGHAASSGSPKACSSCHPSTPGNVADETSSSKVVIHRSCWECHEVGQGPDASRSCQTCHPAGAEEIEPAIQASHQDRSNP